jgi:hypothetical protein
MESLRLAPEYGFNRGIGRLAHCYKDSAAFEVEFVTGRGEIDAVMTFDSKHVPPMQPNEILLAREIPAAQSGLQRSGVFVVRSCIAI